MEIVRLFAAAPISRGHASGGAMTERALVHVTEDGGILEERPGTMALRAKGEITFFSEDIWLRLMDELGVPQADPSVLCRNILVRGVDLGALVGRRFELQGVRFEGLGRCKPHDRLDRSLWPGAHRLLTAWQAGGLRAVPLTSGILVPDAPPPRPWIIRQRG